MSPNPASSLRFVDIAVTPHAPEFHGIYRSKPQHTSDFPSVLSRASQANVKHILLTGMSPQDIDPNLSLCRSHPEICRMTIGVHPYHAQEAWDAGDEYFDALRGKVNESIAEGKKGPLRAFGELGLDFDRLEKGGSKETQISVFQRQLEIFVEEGWDLPLFLHCRNASEEFVKILLPFMDKLPRGGVVHSFVGTKEEMLRLVELGLEIGINGFSFGNGEMEVEMVRAVPLEKLQIETDAPWGWINPNGELSRRFPMPEGVVAFKAKKRDKFEEGLMVKERNESCLIAQVAAIVAGIKGISIEEVAEATWRNSTRMFQLAG